MGKHKERDGKRRGKRNAEAYRARREEKRKEKCRNIKSETGREEEREMRKHKERDGKHFCSRHFPVIVMLRGGVASCYM